MTAQRRNLSVFVALACFASAVALSPTLLESTIFPDGTIIGTPRRAPGLAVMRACLIVLGLYSVIRRPLMTVIDLAALATAAILAGTVGAVLLQLAYVPSPLASGWRSTAPVSEVNQLRFRGQRIEYSPEDYVVVLLGDSQVEAMAMTVDEMPEKVLERSLTWLSGRTRVFSLGTGGYGQDQELLALEEYFKTYRADLVVVWQTRGNDIWNNVFNTYMTNRNPKPTFWLDADGRLQGPTESLEAPLAASPIVVIALWQRIFGLPWRDKSWERRLPPAYVPLAGYDGQVQTVWQEQWDNNLGGMRDENLGTEKSHMSVMLSPRSPRMEYGVALTRALMHRLRDVTEASRARLVAFQADTRRLASEDDQIYGLNGRFYRVSQRQSDANWADVNHGLETEMVPVTIANWRVSAADGHLNADATRQVMTDLAERLRSRIGGESAGLDMP
jgi:hypothetical protein